MDSFGWLLFLYTLRSGDSRQRVNLWRKLKKYGAVPFKTSASLLPDRPEQYERLQWLAKQVRDEGGDATLVRANTIEGLSQTEMIDLFNRARGEEYEQIIKSLRALSRPKPRIKNLDFAEGLERIRAQLAELRAIDFFQAPSGSEARRLYERLAKRGNHPSVPVAPLKRSDYQHRTWVTRPRPEIDRVSSAWLIKRFIDPAAQFVFAPQAKQTPSAVPYDMDEGDLTHHGDNCTFETLVKRFQLRDRAVLRIAEMIHDADLEDEKFGRVEAKGLHRVFKGLARLGQKDEEILEHGFTCFDALYSEIKVE